MKPASQPEKKEREEDVLVGNYTDDFARGSLPTKCPIFSP